jgi:drug/metabolite transporter (DMT)-like permease
MSQVFLAAATLVWGGAFVVGRILVSQLDPLVAAWLRFVIASVAFLILEIAGRAGRRRGGGARRDVAGQRASGGTSAAVAGRYPRWVDYALLGLTGILAYNLFFFYGLTLTTATESSLIIASSPVVVALVGWAFLGESLSPGRVGGISSR